MHSEIHAPAFSERAVIPPQSHARWHIPEKNRYNTPETIDNITLVVNSQLLYNNFSRYMFIDIIKSEREK